LSEAVQSGACVQTDFDYTAPRKNLRAVRRHPHEHARADPERYDYPGGYLKRDQGDEWVRARIEELHVDYETVRGAGNACGLTAGAAVSGLMSNSTKGGSGYNEYIMDDTKGNELIREHGQFDKDSTIEHDLREHVLNDRSRDVTNNETVRIGKDRSQTVGNDETTNIGHDRSEQVGSNETISIGANRTETVGANEIINVAQTRTRTVGVNEAVNVGSAQEVTVGGLQTVTVGSTRAVTVAKSQNVTIGTTLSENVGTDWSETVGKNHSLCGSNLFDHRVLVGFGQPG